MGLSAVDELLALIRRELGAEDVRVVEPDDATPTSPLEIACETPSGKRIVVTFGAEPLDREKSVARLALLMDTFRERVASELGRPSWRPEPFTLHDALSSLAAKAGARDALVIDAHSPVVWGTAGEVRPFAAQVIPYSSAWRDHLAEEVLRTADRFGVSPVFAVTPSDDAVGLLSRGVIERHHVAPLRVDEGTLWLAMADPGDLDALRAAALESGLVIEPVAAPVAAIQAIAASAPASVEGAESESRAAHADREREAWARHLASRRVIPAVRALPELASLAKGGHLHHAQVEPGFAYVAHSFAGIYVLVLVFGGPFDELLARRATAQALPVIERLVLALPPRDPSTGGGAAAIAMRPRRRR